MKQFFRRLVAHIQADAYCVRHMFAKPALSKISLTETNGNVVIGVGTWIWGPKNSWNLTVKLYRVYYPEYQECEITYSYEPQP